jgi:hypothetical protein
MKTMSDGKRAMPMEQMMQRSTGKRMILAGGSIVCLIVGWYLFRPELLFVNQTINEALPTVAASTSPAGAAAQPTTLATGMFHSGAHETRGTATIHQLDDGKRLLRLSGFETSNGPDVHVYLVAADDASDNETVTNAGFIDLGSLKGNIGDQNYDVPQEVDLAKHRAVTIWCARFGVNFGTAPLSAGGTPVATAEPQLLTTGMFHNGAHETKGTAAVLQLADGQRVLRLTGFETSNGPDVHVYLVAAADATDNETVTSAGFIDLGSLKGNIGDQNYEIPQDVDLAKYRAVTIWCARFGVNFGTAPLT